MEDFFIAIDEDAKNIFEELWSIPNATPLYFHKEVINNVSWVFISNKPIPRARIDNYFRELE